MSRDISEIPGLSGKTLVLFRAAGFVNVGSLVGRSAQEIERGLSHTNEEYHIVGWLPSPNAVGAWMRTAYLLEEAGDEDSGPLSEAALSEVRETAVMVARAVMGAELQEAGIVVDSIPIARFVGDGPKSHLAGGGVVHLRTKSRSRRKKRRRTEEVVEEQDVPEDHSHQGPPSHEEEHGESDEEVIAPDHGETDLEPKGNEQEDEELDFVEEHGVQFRNTESLAILNKGNERRNNGMTHKSPRRAVISAVVTLTTMVVGATTSIALIGFAVYFVMVEGRMPLWLLALIPIVPLCLILYGTVGLKARCRLCGYGLFAPKSCRKHEKAHRSIFGSVFATAVRVLVRGTWRCMYCGTKQKLK